MAPILRTGPLSASQIASALQVSSRTALRLIDELGLAAFSWGAGNRRRYALRRALRGRVGEIPLYVVDATGRASNAGPFTLAEPSGSFCNFAVLGWPVEAASSEGWWGGLPYPLYDMQPQGFLGRMFAKREHPSLEVPSDPRTWSDEDVVWVLSRRGADSTGNLILGEAALRLYQGELSHPSDPLRDRLVTSAYLKYADDVIAQGLATSSAAGEFPKFTALREIAGASTPHVIVKFSGRVDSPATQRWSDLLVCEHLALERLNQVDGIQVADSRILQAEGRTFLESERFDRHGRFGRSALVSLHALSGHLLGLSTQDWRAHAQALAQRKLITPEKVDSIRALWWFGRLIANSDMHLGNLSFVPINGRLCVAPTYDMLPMAYAPLPGGEVPPVQWRFELPTPSEANLWRQACEAAIEFWRTTSTDQRISASFRTFSAENFKVLQALAQRV